MTTKHTCNEGSGPVFGRKTPGCARCDELIAGARPIRWNQNDQERIREIQRHDCRRAGCGPVCTFGDW